MYTYTPKLIHAAVTAFIVMAFIALGTKAHGRTLLALNIGALMFAIITAIVLWLLILQGYNERLDRMIELARLYSGMDDEARQAFSFQFPTMQYRMKRGIVRAYFEDTSVLIETFRLFLQTSNNQQVSPLRNWCTVEQPEWAWIEITEWLADHDYIIPDSAAGSHSLLWRGNSYEHLMAYWTAGRRIVDMGTPPPPAEEVGSE